MNQPEATDLKAGQGPDLELLESDEWCRTCGDTHLRKRVSDGALVCARCGSVSTTKGLALRAQQARERKVRALRALMVVTVATAMILMVWASIGFQRAINRLEAETERHLDLIYQNMK